MLWTWKVGIVLGSVASRKQTMHKITENRKKKQTNNRINYHDTCFVSRTFDFSHSVITDLTLFTNNHKKHACICIYPLPLFLAFIQVCICLPATPWWVYVCTVRECAWQKVMYREWTDQSLRIAHTYNR